MPKKHIAAACALSIVLAAAAACGGCATEITVQTSESGNYSTQGPMSSMDYHTYMGKQVTVFINQLTTHILMISYSGTGMYEEETELAKESLKIMQDTYDEVIVTFPAKTDEDDREGLLLAMDKAIQHMESFIEALEEGRDVQTFSADFKNDNAALTVYAEAYYQ